MECLDDDGLKERSAGTPQRSRRQRRRFTGARCGSVMLALVSREENGRVGEGVIWIVLDRVGSRWMELEYRSFEGIE